MATINGRQLRYELKYFITEGEYVVLRDRLLAAMPLDDNARDDTRGYKRRRTREAGYGRDGFGREEGG